MGAASAARIDEEPTVAMLRERQEVEGVYACTRKERRVSRAGTPYLTVELADSTGTIPARAFRDADVLAGRFERGELVRVRGRVERFRAELQIALEAIASAPAAHAHAERFLPVAYRDLDELEGFLEHLARELYDPGFAGLLARLLGDEELRAAIRRAPCAVPSGGNGRAHAGTAAARSAHHAYLGGLLEHTVAVATMALELCALHPRLDRDLLLCASGILDRAVGGRGPDRASRTAPAAPRRALRAHDRRGRGRPRPRGRGDRRPGRRARASAGPPDGPGARRTGRPAPRPARPRRGRALRA